MSSIENSLWCEKHRPQNFEDYVGNNDFVSKAKTWIELDDVPNLLLHSASPGTGKTTAAKIIAKALDADVMYINASDENNIETVRDKIKGFASTIGFSKWKIVILDESDFLTPNAMAALRNIIESFSKNTRFIFTANYAEKLIEPIRSRLVEFHIQPPDKKSVAIRCKQILDLENIAFDIKDLIGLINQFYPDQRRIINALQRNSLSGTLTVDTESKLIGSYCEKILEELMDIKDIKSTFTNIRQIIADSKVRQFDDLFRFLFDNLEEFAGNGKQAQTILHIADFQSKANHCIDKEIQVAAMFINILRDLKS